MNRIKFTTATLCILTLTGCMYSARPVNPATAIQPVKTARWQTVSVAGMTFRDERLAGRSESSDISAASAFASRPHAANGGTSVNALGLSSGQSAVYETYENDRLQKTLALALEDSGMVRAILPDSATVIEGIPADSKSTTAWTHILRNALTGVTLSYLLGAPFTGSLEATVEIRVRENGVLTAKANGSAESQWYIHNMSQLAQAKELAVQTACKQAVIRAVQALQSQAP